jgi:deoxyribonuclease-4
LVEITAGQGSSLGCSFEQLAAILAATGESRVGVCLDTQHMYAAGYDWTTERGYEETFERFERVVGLRHLEAFHLNDSKKPLGSRVDRHEIIGDGLIGLAPFARLVNDPRFRTLPAYLETPPSENGEESYALGLTRLRGLLDQ